MSSETKAFFAVAFPVGVVGVLAAAIFDLGDNATFAATMGPVFIIMIIFMLRDNARDARSDRRVQPPPHRGA